MFPLAQCRAIRALHQVAFPSVGIRMRAGLASTLVRRNRSEATPRITQKVVPSDAEKHLYTFKHYSGVSVTSKESKLFVE